MKNTHNRYGYHKAAYIKARAKVIRQSDICSICGQPIDKSKRYPDPLSASVDHIIPIAKGGAKSDPNNLAVAHLICNKIKSDKITKPVQPDAEAEIKPSRDWYNFGSDHIRGGL